MEQTFAPVYTTIQVKKYTPPNLSKHMTEFNMWRDQS